MDVKLENAEIFGSVLSGEVDLLVAAAVKYIFVYKTHAHQLPTTPLKKCFTQIFSNRVGILI